MYDPNRSAGLEMRMRSFLRQLFEGCMKLFGWMEEQEANRDERVEGVDKASHQSQKSLARVHLRAETSRDLPSSDEGETNANRETLTGCERARR